jgi:ubiquinone biosynthesis protein
MLRIVCWSLVAFAALAVRLAASFVRRSGESGNTIIGRTLAELLQRLGPTFIKVGQLLASRPDLLNGEITRELQRLQERPTLESCHPTGRDLARAALGAPVSQLFAEFRDEPLAVGSVAAVHQARLHDGRTVAVKLLLPRVLGRIKTDLAWMMRIARWLERVPTLASLPIRAVAEEIATCLLRQTDLAAEAAASRHLRNALAATGEIVMPQLIDEICTPAALTMTYIDAFGECIVRRGESDRLAVQHGLRALYQMIFVEGLVHCDMHEGNLRCLQDGRMALIDFGFVAVMDTETRLSFAEFFLAMAVGDGAWCAEIALRLATAYPPTLDRTRFTADIAGIVHAAHGQRVDEFSVARFVGSLFEIQRRHRVRATPSFVMAIVALLVYEGLAKQIDATLDFQQLAMPYLARAEIWSTGTRAGDAASVQRAYSRQMARKRSREADQFETMV